MMLLKFWSLERTRAQIWVGVRRGPEPEKRGLLLIVVSMRM